MNFNKTEIVDCPYCKNNKNTCIKQNKYNQYYVYCNKCGSEGTKTDFKIDAIYYWKKYIKINDNHLIKRF